MLQFREKLGLSYHNSRALLQRVDSLPERAEWQERWVSFKDRPGEKHLVQFRDIIQAIRALLGNPKHADKIVYRPRRLFRDASRQQRIYGEMWTGHWWHAVQVSNISMLPALYLHLFTVIVTGRRSCSTGDYCHGQNTTHAVLWQQIRLPRIHDSRQHSSFLAP